MGALCALSKTWGVFLGRILIAAIFCNRDTTS
jgi:hypothetical protein